MKALSILQPWATLVAIGAKQYETRSWSTTYRGPLAIHASKGYGELGKNGFAALIGKEPFASTLNDYARSLNPQSLYELVRNPIMPRGMIIAMCEIVDCVSVDKLKNLSDREFAFGDYSPRRFAWKLGNMRMLKAPIPIKGALGLWEWSPVAELHYVE